MDEHHSEDKESHTVGVDPGDPNNDQMLAQAKDDFRGLLDTTIHPLVDQAEAQGLDLATLLSTLVDNWKNNNAYMPRERLATLAALSLFVIAANERVVVEDGKTAKMSEDFRLL